MQRSRGGKAHWLAASTLLVAVACGGGATEETAATSSTATTATVTTAPATTTTTSPSNTEITFELQPGPGVDEAASEVEAGRQFEVAWTGPNAKKDYVTIVVQGAAERSYLSYFYTDAGSTGKLLAPVGTGAYELRYVDGETEATLASQAITVTDVSITLEAPMEVEAGTVFEVTWSGPDGPSDYITVVPVGSAEAAYESYFNTASGDTGTLVASIEPGDYELRYMNGAGAATMATRPIVVAPFEITLEAPPEVEAGSEFSVTWTGPNGPSDYITIVPGGSAEGAYLDYAYTAEGSTVKLLAPAEPGDYEIWYASDRVPGTFASITIVVK